MESRKVGQAKSEEDVRRGILEKRAFYGRYEQRLLGFLEGKGICPLPNFTDGLSGTGALLAPAEGIGDAGEDRYLYLLRAGDKLYGLSCSSVLRDLTPGAGGEPLKLPNIIVDQPYCQQIAAASDGKYVYVLNESGAMEHTNPDLLETIPVTTYSGVLRAIWQPYFTEEQVRQAAAEYLSGMPPIFELPLGRRQVYYDQDAKVFFFVNVYGSYYHGYAVDCPRTDKDNAVLFCTRRRMLEFLRDSCAEGEIPDSLLPVMFEEAPKDVKYDVPYDYYMKNFSSYENYPPDWF